MYWKDLEPNMQSPTVRRTVQNGETASIIHVCVIAVGLEMIAAVKFAPMIAVQRMTLVIVL